LLLNFRRVILVSGRSVEATFRLLLEVGHLFIMEKMARWRVLWVADFWE
jgi:hypothetical protein